MKLGCFETAYMEDFLKFFKTVMDFKGLSYMVTEQSLIKKSRPVFYFATVIRARLRPVDRESQLRRDRYRYLHLDGRCDKFCRQDPR